MNEEKEAQTLVQEQTGCKWTHPEQVAGLLGVLVRRGCWLTQSGRGAYHCISDRGGETLLLMPTQAFALWLTLAFWGLPCLQLQKWGEGACIPRGQMTDPGLLKR